MGDASDDDVCEECVDALQCDDPMGEDGVPKAGEGIVTSGDCSHVELTMHRYLEGMGNMRHSFIKGMKRFSELYPTFKWCSACSGSEMYTKSLDDCRRFFASEYDIMLEFPVLFGCDNEPSTHRFMMEQFSEDELPMIFPDITGLTDLRALNVRTGRMTLIPWGNGFTCGFSCLSKTKLNKNAAKNKFCIQQGSTTETTAITYRGARNFIVKSRPDFSFLENLIALEEEDPDGINTSDEEFIVKDIESKGFAMLIENMEAGEYASWAGRMRKIFLILNGNTRKNRATLAQAHKFIEAMRTEDAWDANAILLDAMSLPTPDRSSSTSSSGDGPSPKVPRALWRDEHREIFRCAGLPWPPPLQSAPGLRYDGMQSDGRMQECAYFYHTFFPVTEPCFGQWQSVDVNMSMPRTLNVEDISKAQQTVYKADLKNPWLTGPMRCLTGSSRMLLRYQQSPSDVPVVRMLLGVEAFRAMGWDRRHWAGYVPGGPFPFPECDNQTLCTMAGRAFSSFVFTTAATAVMSAIGLAGGIHITETPSDSDSE